MSKKIILNADMGEGFGSYQLGDDRLMEYLSSVNLACGFHAGDPMVMRNSVQLAAKHGISIGAHPGFADRQGFGRRMLQISQDELYCDLLYQFGALDAFVKKEGTELTHVCPHGVMDSLVSDNREYAVVFMDAVRDYKKDMRIIIEENCLLAEMCKESDLSVASVGYPDLEYDENGKMIITRNKEIMDPQKVVQQSLSMIINNEYICVDGSKYSINPEVICIHSDVPNSMEILKELRKGLDNAGIVVTRF